jgi:hypothetical protein
MTLLSAFRARRSENGSSPQAGQQSAAPPFSGYDRLDGRGVIDRLSGQTQVELEAVEAYERSHRSREPVLDKLRWMRGREPLPGYDALSVEEIVAALEPANLATLKQVRCYERKFANRPDVLEEVTRDLHRRQAERPAGPVPASQPGGG